MSVSQASGVPMQPSRVRYGDHVGHEGRYVGLVVDIDPSFRHVIVAQPPSADSPRARMPVGVMIGEVPFKAALLHPMMPAPRD